MIKKNRRDFLRMSGFAGLGLTGAGFFGLGKKSEANAHGTSTGATERDREREIAIAEQNGDLRLLDWEPVTQMVVKETVISKPKFPVIDIHNHLRDLNRLEEYLETMDEAGVWKTVSLEDRQSIGKAERGGTGDDK